MSGVMVRACTTRDVNGNPRRVRFVLKAGADGPIVLCWHVEGKRLGFVTINAAGSIAITTDGKNAVRDVEF